MGVFDSLRGHVTIFEEIRKQLKAIQLNVDKLEFDSTKSPVDGVPSVPAPTFPTPGVLHPTDVIPELANWTVMLPTGEQGDPENLYLIGKSIPDVFYVGLDKAVVYRAIANGVHSKNSKYSRTESRQMVDTKWTKAAWKSSGDHSLTCDISLDASGLVTRKRINGMQIHNGSDDVCQIMLHETLGLGFMWKDGKEFIKIDPNYIPGTKFKCLIRVIKDRIIVLYNGRVVVDVPFKGTGLYWKVGAYIQSGGASEYVEPAGAFGIVKLYSLKTTGGATLW